MMEEKKAKMLGVDDPEEYTFFVHNLTDEPVEILAENPEEGNLIGFLSEGDDPSGRRYRSVTVYESEGFAYTMRIPRGITLAMDVLGQPIPVADYDYSEVRDLPDPVEGDLYIVTEDVVRAARDQGRKTDDLLVVGREVRDSSEVLLGYAELTQV